MPVQDQTTADVETDTTADLEPVDPARRPPEKTLEHVRTPFGSWTTINSEPGVPQRAALVIGLLVAATVTLNAVLVADGRDSTTPAPAVDSSSTPRDSFEAAEAARFEGLRPARDSFEAAETARFEGLRPARDSFEAAEAARFNAAQPIEVKT